MTIQQIENETRAEVEGLKPYVTSLARAVERFDRNPHIGTGHERQTAFDALCSEIKQTAQRVWDNWSQRYSMTVSSDQMAEIFNRVVDGLTFDTDAELQCWRGITDKEVCCEYLD